MTDNNAPADDVVARQAVALANALGGDDADTVMDLVAAIERLRAERDEWRRIACDAGDEFNNEKAEIEEAAESFHKRMVEAEARIRELERDLYNTTVNRDDWRERAEEAELRTRELEDGLREVADEFDGTLTSAERMVERARALIERNSK